MAAALPRPKRGRAGLKGRVSIGFAHCMNKPDEIDETELQTTIMGTPRASFAPFYLRGAVKDWSVIEHGVAGRKRYPTRYEGGTGQEAIMNTLASWKGKEADRRSDEIFSKLKFLTATGEVLLRFRGKIKLHNVTKAELGAIIWCLLLGGQADSPYRHMIGRAKNAGAGQARVDRINADIRPHSENPQKLEWARGDALDTLNEYIEAFASHMRKFTPAWPDIAPVQDLLAVSDPSLWSSEQARERLRYLSLPEHGQLTRLVKADISKAPPSDIPADHSALSARRGADA